MTPLPSGFDVFALHLFARRFERSAGKKMEGKKMFLS
jgi:hypothetical protein